uniref:Uncharacterized protein n=1 Tax=Ditylenchus dipsaci TaxID=166011 RepID=A0A915DMB2_9BILA
MHSILSIALVCLSLGPCLVVAWPFSGSEETKVVPPKNLRCNYEADPEHGVPHSGFFMCQKYCGWYERNLPTKNGAQFLFQCPDDDCEVINHVIGNKPTMVTGVPTSPTNPHPLIVPDAYAFTCCGNDSNACDGRNATQFMKIDWNSVHPTPVITTPEPTTPSTEGPTTTEPTTTSTTTQSTTTSASTTEPPATNSTEDPTTPEPVTTSTEPTTTSTTTQTTTTTLEPTTSTTQSTTTTTTLEPTTTTAEPTTEQPITSTTEEPTTHALIPSECWFNAQLRFRSSRLAPTGANSSLV